VEPDNPRHFDIELAKQKLDAAGYVLDGNGKRLDKEGKPITLALVHPNTSDTYSKSAQFVKEWYGELGIDVSVQSYDSDTLTDLLLPPEADGKAKYDIELWGWSGSPDPNGLTIVFKCDQIGNLSDSNYCNPEYDKLYDKQSAEAGDARHATLAQMQNLIYDEAPYDILFYDSNLDVYRNDRFAGWQNMPANGTPFFSYGILDYTLLTDAKAQPSATPAAPAASASAGTSASPAAPAPDSSAASSSSTPTLLIAVIAIAAVVVVGGFLFNRRRAAPSGEDE
jgi:peptide/nickel transport system substrate-binding protein